MFPKLDTALQCEDLGPGDVKAHVLPPEPHRLPRKPFLPTPLLEALVSPSSGSNAAMGAWVAELGQIESCIHHQPAGRNPPRPWAWPVTAGSAGSPLTYSLLDPRTLLWVPSQLPQAGCRLLGEAAKADRLLYLFRGSCTWKAVCCLVLDASWSLLSGGGERLLIRAS